ALHRGGRTAIGEQASEIGLRGTRCPGGPAAEPLVAVELRGAMRRRDHEVPLGECDRIRGGRGCVFTILTSDVAAEAIRGPGRARVPVPVEDLAPRAGVA